MSKHVLVDDTLSVLSQKLGRLRILTAMLTTGRAREALSDAQADELDWWLDAVVDEAQDVLSALGDAIQNAKGGAKC